MSNTGEPLESRTDRAPRRRGCLWCSGCFVAGLLVLALVLALAGVAYQAIATARDEHKYLPPGQLVSVEGYHLHIHCTGEGSPTVVLDSGLPGWSLDWWLVQPEVARFTRVCSYDRAGFGWSEPGPTPRTSRQIVEELRDLLAGARVAGPYVLVGHSFGGYNARLFAASYPSDVAGVVLVDAVHEDEYARMPPELQRLDAAQRQVYAFCRIIAPLGLMRFVGETGLDPLLDEFAGKLPAEVQPMWKAGAYRAQYCGTAYAEMSAFEESADQVRAAGSLGDLPLVVVTAGTQDPSLALPGLPLDELNQVHMELQADLLSLSSNSAQIVAEESGHYVHLDQPDLVVDAIRQVVETARR